MESVDECLPPTEKETSDLSMSSGLLAQGDKDKSVSMLTAGDRCQRRGDRDTDDRGGMHGHRLKQTKENLQGSILQDGESVSMKWPAEGSTTQQMSLEMSR